MATGYYDYDREYDRSHDYEERRSYADEDRRGDRGYASKGSRRAEEDWDYGPDYGYKKAGYSGKSERAGGYSSNWDYQHHHGVPVYMRLNGGGVCACLDVCCVHVLCACAVCSADCAAPELPCRVCGPVVIAVVTWQVTCA